MTTKRNVAVLLALGVLALVLVLVERVGIEEGSPEYGSERVPIGAGEESVDTDETTAVEGQVRSVPTLNMSGQQLTTVPPTVFEHSELVVVNLSRNNLTGALPAEVRHLENLEWLDLSHNQFTGVPAELGQLSRLRYLDLSHNQLTGLPYELGNLQNLEVLDVSGNEYSLQDLRIIQQHLPSTTRIVIE